MSLQQLKGTNGLAFSATGQADVDQFEALTSAYLGFRTDIGVLLKQLLIQSPQMPMALCMKGYIAKMIVSASHSARAIGILKQLEIVLDQCRGNERECLHAKALHFWCVGDLLEATKCWEKILIDYPTDSLALRLAHYLHFYSGDAYSMRDSIARVIPSWSDELSDYGYVLGMYGFGLEESGDYIKAEDFARRGVEKNPADTWSVHAVAHVMEMTGRIDEGVKWVVDQRCNWSSVNNFRFHLDWHLALYYLQSGDSLKALELYDSHIASEITADFNLDMCNATSLLWRLEMLGVDVGNRWQDLVVTAESHIDDKELVFVSLHYYLALLAAGEAVLAGKLNDSLMEWANRSDQGSDTQARICKKVGMDLAKATQHARAHEFAQATQVLNRCLPNINLIGGSHAQRNLYSLVLQDVNHRAR